MNDPHIQTLIYRIAHSQDVHYKKAVPFEYDASQFRVIVDNGTARFQMKEHFADVALARRVVDPFIESWELSASLEIGPRSFELQFLNAEVIDRSPTPGVVSLQGVAAQPAAGTVSVLIGQPRYPEPAPHLVVNDDIRAMSPRFDRYRQGGTTLGDVTYFCLTVLEQSAGGRSEAASKFSVSKTVLDQLGRLSAERGGINEARKAAGLGLDYSESERLWLEEALKQLILRVAEIAAGRNSSPNKITMDDLPSIQIPVKHATNTRAFEV